MCDKTLYGVESEWNVFDQAAAVYGTMILYM